MGEICTAFEALLTLDDFVAMGFETSRRRFNYNHVEAPPVFEDPNSLEQDQFIHKRRTRKGRTRVKKIKHYSSKHSILLVGEGDFSFARCLARAFGSATNLVATSLDSQEELMLKYPEAMANVEELKERGCTVIHGVDADSMNQHDSLCGKLFDRIVFNFPHAGFLLREHDSYQIMFHRNVVEGFFSSAEKMVTCLGEVHVTHKTAHPFNKWEIEKLAEEQGLKMVEKVCFNLWEYPGYENKRGDGPRSNETFPVGECSTFKFTKSSTYYICERFDIFM